MKGIFRQISIPTFVAVIAFVYVDKLLGITDSLFSGRGDEKKAIPSQENPDPDSVADDNSG